MSEEHEVTDEERADEVKAFSTSGDTPLDGAAQPVPPVAEPVPGNVFDDDLDPSRANGQ